MPADVASAGLPPRARAVGLALALGGLMVVIDTTVTVVAVPAIVSGLHASLATVQWVTTGYLLGIVAVIPLSGRAAARFGARRVYLGALLAFTLFSVLAGLAWSAASLAAFRAAQGLGGGLLNPVGQAIALGTVPRDRRGRMMSLLALPLVIGPVAGPPLSGWLIGALSWRWIFLVNLPLGLLTLLICARVLPPSTPGGERRPVDWGGLGLLSGGAVLVVLGGTMLGQPGAAPPVPLGVLAAGLGALVLFARRAWRAASPLVDLRLLARPAFRTPLGVLACFGAGYFGAMAVLPLYVQGVRGDPSELAGTLLLPQAIAVGLTAQVATRLVDRIPPHRIVLTGTGCALLGALGLLVTTTAGAAYPWIVAASTLVSIGAGATGMPAMTAALRDLEGAETPRGTTLLALCQQLAAALGVALTAVAVSLLVAARLPGGVPAMIALDRVARESRLSALATAVGGAYLVTATAFAGAFLGALLLLRGSRRTGESEGKRERAASLKGDGPQRVEPGVSP
ncbi:DHA2 family efflux MFS transporter permease subunit [Actinoplanes sp. NPDC051851]|uniref:DHA2 family efflux MFS transporter permease subunit n=1 Tax=Actinoplanes sp. NPDC051851 TaxID=3154753 RepID=UPI003418FA78